VRRCGAPPAPPAADRRAVSFRRSDYAYPLPDRLIARRPPSDRASARLMVVDRHGAGVEHLRFADVVDYLEPGDVVVLNETRVVPARLFGHRRGTGGGVELLLVRRIEAASEAVVPAAGGGTPARRGALFECVGRPGRRLRPGVELVLEDGALEGEVVAVDARGRRLVRLDLPGVPRPGTDDGDAAASLEAVLDRVGHMPIPPYLGRRDDARDRQDYQTVFARVPGAIAAPTAGLHFTADLLAAIAARGVAVARLVLHVGPGTFTPVECDDVRGHRMEAERFTVPAACAAAIEAARAAGRRVVAVGTTVVRSLETAARRGDGRVVACQGETDLFIHPPFEFLAVDALITNFHLPESTLLMLVAAFAGRQRVLAAYRQAVERQYLVYSYGDAMLIR